MASRPRHVSECYFRKHFARDLLEPLYFRCSLVLTRNSYRGKRPACYRNCRHGGKRYRCVFLYSVHKGTSLRGKMKKMGSRRSHPCHTSSRCISRRDITPPGLRPFFLLIFLIHDETASMDYSQDILTERDEWDFFQKSVRRRKWMERITHSPAAYQTWNCITFITGSFVHFLKMFCE